MVLIIRAIATLFFAVSYQNWRWSVGDFCCGGCLTFVGQFGRFLGVGGISTAAHFLTLWILHELLRANLIMATTAGYLVGALFNYILNRKFTFDSTRAQSGAMPRFFCVVAAGLVLNAGLMAMMESFAHSLPYMFRQCIATGLVLLSNFFLHKHWTFEKRKEEPSQ